MHNEKFIEDLILYIAKLNEAMFNVKSPWLHYLIMFRVNKFWFPSWKQLMEK
jgi:hypothetical protein